MKKLNLLILALFLSPLCYAQDDELAELLGEEEQPVVYTKKTFYSSRIVNSHTTESIEKKVLDFRIT